MITAKPKKRYWQITDDYWNIQSSDLSFVGRVEDGYIEISRSRYFCKLLLRWALRQLLSIPPIIHVESNLMGGMGESVYLKGTKRVVGKTVPHFYRGKCIGSTTEYTQPFMKWWNRVGFSVKHHDTRVFK